MNAKQKDRLMTAVIKLLLAAGFKAATDRRYDYYKPDSRGGEVGVTIHADTPCNLVGRRGWNIWIAGMFTDPDRATAAGVNCNPYTGKDNYFNLDNVQAIEYAINQYR